MDVIIDQLIPGSIHICLASAATRPTIRMNQVYDDLVYSNNERFVGAQCFLQTLAPSSLFNWILAYADDKDTGTIIKAMIASKTSIVPTPVIASVHKGYREYLKKALLTITGDKLLLCKLTNIADRYLGLIVVPVTLRRKLFAHYHSDPSGGHMGTYKTLFCLRMRFFWPHMREDIKQWV